MLSHRAVAAAAAQLLAALLLFVCGATQAWPQGCPLTQGATAKPTMTFGNSNKPRCRGITPYEYNCQWLPGLQDTKATSYTLSIFIENETPQHLMIACPKQPRCPPYSCPFKADAMDSESYAATVIAEGGPGGRVLSDTYRFIPINIVEPDPPVDLRAMPRGGSEDEILVTWKFPPTWPEVDRMFPLQIELQYKLAEHDEHCKNVTADKGARRFVILNTRPGAAYKVRARARESIMLGLWSSWTPEITSSPWRTKAADTASRVRATDRTRTSTTATAKTTAAVAMTTASGISSRAHTGSREVPRHGKRLQFHHVTTHISDAVTGSHEAGASPPPDPDTHVETDACSVSFKTKALCLLAVATATAFITTAMILCIFYLWRKPMGHVKKYLAAVGRTDGTRKCPPTAPATASPPGPAGPPTAPHFREVPPPIEGEDSSVACESLMNWEYWAAASNPEPPSLDSRGAAASRAHPLRA
ncbi:uncharacterized protein LOC144731469 isoform X1 [Lampetra planeri]